MRPTLLAFMLLASLSFQMSPIDAKQAEASSDGVTRCATHPVAPDEAAAVQARLKQLKLNPGSSAFRLTVPVAFHVITCGTLGDVTQAQIDAQLRELNNA